MQGCTYIDKENGEPLAWTANYNSGIMRYWIEKRVKVIITEEQFWEHQQRLFKWLEEQGAL